MTTIMETNMIKSKNMLNKKIPLVSVIMPVYNAGGYLVEAIESILKQTVADFEFLIIDDASRDDSWNLISRFAKKDKRIKAFRNKNRVGLVRSLNFLIPQTRGKFVARMDSDDISLPERFAKQIKYLENHQDVVACGGQEIIIDAKGRMIAQKFFPTETDKCYNKLMNFMVIQPPVLMARGEAFRMNRYDNHIFRNDDITIHFKLLKRGSFGNCKETIFKYRKLPNSLTHTDPKKVYFLALKARVNAIIYHEYRPSIVNIMLAVFETMFVAVLPNFAITPLFESMRLKENSEKNSIRKESFSFFNILTFAFNKQTNEI